MTERTDLAEPTPLFVLGSFVAACCASVLRLPDPGEVVTARTVTLEPGGKGFNVAIGTRRLGHPVDCMIAVGDDLFGALAEPMLVRNGLSADLIRRYPVATGAGLGFIQDKGENCVAVFPGANLLLTAEDVCAARPRIERAAIVIAQFEIADAPIKAAFAIARRAGRKTLLNPSPFRPIDPALLRDTTILVANEVEANALAIARGLDAANGSEPLRAFGPLADNLAVAGLDLLVVTLGPFGAIAFPRGGAPIHHNGFVVDALDSLGAGDAFTAAFAVALAEDRSVADCLTRAAANGALMASRPGTIDALPTLGDLDRFICSRLDTMQDTIKCPK